MLANVSKHPKNTLVELKEGLVFKREMIHIFIKDVGGKVFWVWVTSHWLKIAALVSPKLVERMQ